MAEAKKAPKAKTTAKGKQYVVNPEKPYNPKAAHNVRSWEKLQETLPATMGEMMAALKFSETEKHTNFIGYMIRGHHIVEKE